MALRRAAVAGAWYPATAGALAAAVDAHLARADALAAPGPAPDDALVAIVAPHAGLVYSGPVAAHAYRLLRQRPWDVIVLVGPSHFLAFEGVACWPAGSFETPLGPLAVDEELAAALMARCALVHERPDAHGREHSLELQLPFLAHLAPAVPILPLVMGHQTRATAETLADALVAVLGRRRAAVVASSDLSHYHDAGTAQTLDARVMEAVDAFDADRLMALLEDRPDHACGGGPMVTVLRAARALGARTCRVLHYADSGDVSGDKHAVVGYLAAAAWAPAGRA